MQQEQPTFCRCGHENPGNFCPDCGARQPGRGRSWDSTRFPWKLLQPTDRQDPPERGRPQTTPEPSRPQTTPAASEEPRKNPANMMMTMERHSLRAVAFEEDTALVEGPYETRALISPGSWEQTKKASPHIWYWSVPIQAGGGLLLGIVISIIYTGVDESHTGDWFHNLMLFGCPILAALGPLAKINRWKGQCGKAADNLAAASRNGIPRGRGDR